MTNGKLLTSAPEPRRKWIRYSLRAAFAALTMFAIACACLALRVQTFRSRDAAFKRIVERGGQIEMKRFSPNWFDGFALWSVGLEPVNVITVRLQGREVGDDELHLVAHFEDLRELDLDGSQVTDDGLLVLGGLSKLEFLSLRNTRIRGIGLQALHSMPRMAMFELAGVALDTRAWPHIYASRNLTSLDVCGCPVGDEFLGQIAKLLKLNNLNLENTGVTDAGLALLTRLNLVILNIEGTRTTDQGFAHLATISSLRILLADNTAISAEGLLDLYRALPNTSILANADIESTASRLERNRQRRENIDEGTVRRLREQYRLEILDELH